MNVSNPKFPKVETMLRFYIVFYLCRYHCLSSRRDCYRWL